MPAEEPDLSPEDEKILEEMWGDNASNAVEDPVEELDEFEKKVLNPKVKSLRLRKI